MIEDVLNALSPLMEEKRQKRFRRGYCLLEQFINEFDEFIRIAYSCRKSKRLVDRFMKKMKRNRDMWDIMELLLKTGNDAIKLLKGE